MGQAYVLGCPDGGEVHLRQAVARVDAAMGKIRDSGKVKARDRLAVLAALNIAFELEQAQQPIAPDATDNSAPAPASPPPAEAQNQSPADAAPPSAPPASDTRPAHDPDWHKRLIAKLDDALSQDGRLL